MLTREQYFPGQGEEEQVALFIRRHWMAFIPWIIMSPFVLFAGLATAVWLWLSFAGTVGSPDTTGVRLAIIVGTTMFLLTLLFLFMRAWMSHYLDVTIVTERRLIDIEQDGIFGRSVAEQSLLRVQDVSAHQQSFFHHFLNYGNLHVETAGEQPNFDLHNIPRPNEVAKTILNLHDRLMETGGHEIDLEVAEGEIGPIGEPAHRTKTHSHPLEELLPYFPEPSLAHPPSPAPDGSNEKLKTQSAHRLPGEGELHEGETITLDR